MTRGWSQASATFGVALRFFFRHYAAIAAFGALASAQRFLAVSGDERFAFAGGVGGEVFTAVVRLMFLAWLVRTLFRAERAMPWAQLGRRLSRFVAGNAPMLLASAAMLVGLTLVFKVVPELLAADLSPDAHATFLSWELAIKNVTVIPFVMVWVTTIAREALRASDHATDREREPASA
ncbi:hypothetical protein Bcav_1518 [Beutenbergia cavernae DSM 12333]|uniref:Uncharacterized protein n=1 Tax=Beutenbergia cavernae (strain ATCC BAA-8 / DSM 12333 / CCUG 43141 / JCM 11478 / NBRC 16432 / NCIMB 13614 / HKI 0122) TaxID=471853 RepID=C5C375_BEUC1|nr:hypothetical protein [Beutenbergia cavernae]ACQ79774.1 hypothetical protein Bcav_1518 [Beutenbergia cavernae DSM 12333]